MKKTWIAVICSVTMVMLMILFIFCITKHFSDQMQAVSERRMNTDRNGTVLAKRDSALLFEVEKYYGSVLQTNLSMPKKNLKLTIDSELQKLCGELMAGKMGCIVAIEPSTGEVLCMVSSTPFNQCVMGQYSPGGVFRAVQGLIFLSEDIITPETYYPCEKGFKYNGIRVDCYKHTSPLTLKVALRTSCNGYFCWGYLDMMKNAKYGSAQIALEKWREYTLSLGFGNRLGIDLPGELRGLVPSVEYYDMLYDGHWSGLTNLSNAVGLGEIVVTPLQLANLSATIANRGYYFTPHIVKVIQDVPIDGKYTSVHFSTIKREAYDTIIDALRSSDLWGISGLISRKEKKYSSYIGFAPVENPKIAVAVYVENGDMEGQVAVPIGETVMEKYLNINN